MKIIVTGGSGYIGSHTVVELQACGLEVVIVDNLSNSRIEVVDAIEKISGVRPFFEKIDVKDLIALRKVFEKYGDVAGVIHFAAYKAVGESMAKPLDYYYNNINCLMNVLICMKIYDVSNIVFSSSCTVYGQPEVLPVTEKTERKKAESPYANTKKVCEDILRDECRAVASFNAIALRYFNPIGAHPSAMIGELPLGSPNNLVPFLTQSVAGKNGPLRVFGDDYDTGDGTAIRDYIDVVDLAKAHVVAVERLIYSWNKSNYEVFNIGRGKGLSVLEIIRLFEEATGEKVDYRITDRREGDIVKVWADTTYAIKELGWRATTDIRDTLNNAWRFQLKVCK